MLLFKTLIAACLLLKSTCEIVENVKFNTGLLFPKTTTVGYLVGATIPIDLKDESAYVFFGFEEYYVLPDKQYNWFPQDEAKSHETKRSIFNSFNSSLLTRTHAYRLLETKLELYGMNGKTCLLRTICEVNESPLAEHNGVYGDIIQIIFSPTSSEDEGLPDEYYEAEFNGHIENCTPYYEECPSSLLDLFTTEYTVHPDNNN